MSPAAPDIYHDFLDGRSIDSSITTHRLTEDAEDTVTKLDVFLTVHHELTIC